MDTIAAIATGSAPSAIGLLRLSGEGAFAALDRVFFPAGAPLASRPPRTMVWGEMRDAQGRTLDRGLAARFPAPGSYTGEDCAELYCHGSPVVLRALLERLFSLGVRQAEAGEFTRRAFLNGRMDLTEAEAVIDLIDAETEEAARNAAGQLSGALSRRIGAVYDRLMAVVSRFYAVVDYPDEDIADADPAETDAALAFAETALAALLGSFSRGRILKNGVRTAIVGRPNAGKSSLLNALAGYDRSIVTPVPGTTRDTVEETVRCGGAVLRLIDTAGLRETEDAVERLGVARTREALRHAELALAVLDPSAPGFPSAEDEAVLTLAADCPRWILVFSKSDLSGRPAALPAEGPGAPARRPDAVVTVSAVTLEGLDALEAAVSALYPDGGAACGEILTNPRQAGAVSRALTAVRGARAAFSGGLTPDAVLTDAETALSALGELTGKTLREDLAANIFSRFCVGK